MNLPEEQQRYRHPLANYQFSSDEIRILKECNSEAFFRRSLPFMSIFGSITYFGIKQGYLKPSGKYGAVPKVVASVIFGFFVGKFSYQEKCAEKFLHLPNSRLGDIMRQQLSQQQSGLYRLKPDPNISMGMTLSQFKPNPSDIYTDEHLQPQGKGSALDLDVESRPSFAGLDDIYRPSLDNTVSTEIDSDIPLEPLKPGISYDELRQRNRDEYMKKQQNFISSANLTSKQNNKLPVVKQQQERIDRDDHLNETTRTNKYGDSWSN